MRKFVLTSLLVFVAIANAHAADDNAFTNPSLGFSVAKPESWFFITAEQNLENIKRTELGDENLQALVVKYASAPLVAIAKYEEPYDDLNPSFKVNTRPFGNLDPNEPARILSLILPQFQQLFPDFQVVIPPSETQVAGIKSGYAQFSYSLKVPDGRTFPTTSELWIVPHGPYFFMMGAGTRTDEKTGSRQEIADIVATIRIE